MLMPNAFTSFTTRIRAPCFLRSEQGSLTTVFALTLVLVVIATGGAIDLYGAYQNRQKLAQVAVLACQYASRPSIIQTASSSYSGSGGGATYVNNVNSFITNSLSSQGFRLSQATASPFTYTTGGTSDVALSANVPTSFMTMFGMLGQMRRAVARRRLAVELDIDCRRP
jgi:Flp pilus assembly protein TadG